MARGGETEDQVWGGYSGGTRAGCQGQNQEGKAVRYQGLIEDRESLWVLEY